MCEAVKNTIELQTPLEDGKTKLDHLIQLEQSTGRNHVPDVEVPPHGMHLWEWFFALSNARGSSGFGPSPLFYSEIQAWMQITHTDAHPWEIDVLKAMDHAYMQAQSEISQSKGKKKK